MDFSAKLKVFLLNCNIGQKKQGVEIGPSAIFNSLRDRYFLSNHESIDFPSESSPFSSCGYANSKEKIKECSLNWIALGGDHSCAVSTVGTVIEKQGDDALIVWIDAHADINTYEASLSKNTHGMPVSFLMEQGLKPENIIYIGLRDLDDFEVNVLVEKNIRFYTNSPYLENFAKGWNPKIALPNILSDIESRKKKYVHFSIDIDGIDPSETPSTGTAVQNGLSTVLLNDIIHFTKNVKSADIVEFNPLIGNQNDVQTTLKTIQKIFGKLFQKMVL